MDMLRYFFCFTLVAQRGYVEVARVLLENSADVNFQSSSGKTALMMACFSGSNACFALVLFSIKINV